VGETERDDGGRGFPGPIARIEEQE